MRPKSVTFLGQTKSFLRAAYSRVHFIVEHIVGTVDRDIQCVEASVGLRQPVAARQEVELDFTGTYAGRIAGCV